MGYETIGPKLAEDVLVAKGACIIGDVEIGPGSSVWFNAVIRADFDRCVIGKRSNIQDCAVLHCAEGLPIVIGDNVTVGHNAIIHSATIGDNTLIGMGSIIMNGARIGSNCVIGAGALVTGGTVIPDGSLAMGSPAKVRRMVSDDEIAANADSAKEYAAYAQSYLQGRAKLISG